MESRWRGPVAVMREKIEESRDPLIVGDTRVYFLGRFVDRQVVD
jgi:hypothetical protein